MSKHTFFWNVDILNQKQNRQFFWPVRAQYKDALNVAGAARSADEREKTREIIF
jgi:hypothetical protein